MNHKNLAKSLLTKAMFAIGLTSLVLTASSTVNARNSYTVEVHCEGKGLEVWVVDWKQGGLALYVFDGNETLEAAWADHRIIEDGERISREGYKTGNLREGGFDLRIRTRDTRIPATEGSAHLSYTGANDLLQCDQF